MKAAQPTERPLRLRPGPLAQPLRQALLPQERLEPLALALTTPQPERLALPQLRPVLPPPELPALPLPQLPAPPPPLPPRSRATRRAQLPSLRLVAKV